MRKFITDAGMSRDVVDQDGTLVMRLERYAFWADNGRGKPEVVACSDDLDELRERYGDHPVALINEPKEGQ